MAVVDNSMKNPSFSPGLLPLAAGWDGVGCGGVDWCGIDWCGAAANHRRRAPQRSK
jgi:hypothetical protein